VPPTVLANLSKAETRIAAAPQPQAPAETSFMASILGTSPSTPAPAVQQASSSASPVISRPVPAPVVMAAPQPARAPVAPVYTAADVPPVQAAPVRASAAIAASTAQPVVYQAPALAPVPAPASPPPAISAAPASQAPADPNALQKLNRSGKGGKLPSPSDVAGMVMAGDMQGQR
jgi:hypothetical protein